MLVHSVFFWLKSGLDAAAIAAFEDGLHALKGISAAEAVYVGTPAATPDRPVIDSSYDYALTVVLKDLSAHDAYQVDALHKAFIENFASFWDRVLIYDAD